MKRRKPKRRKGAAGTSRARMTMCGPGHCGGVGVCALCDFTCETRTYPHFHMPPGVPRRRLIVSDP